MGRGRGVDGVLTSCLFVISFFNAIAHGLIVLVSRTRTIKVRSLVQLSTIRCGFFREGGGEIFEIMPFSNMSSTTIVVKSTFSSLNIDFVVN